MHFHPQNLQTTPDGVASRKSDAFQSLSKYVCRLFGCCPLRTLQQDCCRRYECSLEREKAHRWCFLESILNFKATACNCWIKWHKLRFKIPAQSWSYDYLAEGHPKIAQRPSVLGLILFLSSPPSSLQQYWNKSRSCLFIYYCRIDRPINWIYFLCKQFAFPGACRFPFAAFHLNDEAAHCFGGRAFVSIICRLFRIVLILVCYNPHHVF